MCGAFSACVCCVFVPSFPASHAFRRAQPLRWGFSTRHTSRGNTGGGKHWGFFLLLIFLFIFPRSSCGACHDFFRARITRPSLSVVNGEFEDNIAFQPLSLSTTRNEREKKTRSVGTRTDDLDAM